MEPDFKKYHTLLIERKQELENHAKKSAESRKPVELDQTKIGRLSRQDALMQQAMAEATQIKREQEIQRINSALLRIENDKFGYCLNCDEEISHARLLNDPSMPTCINCAA